MNRFLIPCLKPAASGPCDKSDGGHNAAVTHNRQSCFDRHVTVSNACKLDPENTALDDQCEGSQSYVLEASPDTTRAWQHHNTARTLTDCQGARKLQAQLKDVPKTHSSVAPPANWVWPPSSVRSPDLCTALSNTDRAVVHFLAQ